MELFISCCLTSSAASVCLGNNEITTSSPKRFLQPELSRANPSVQIPHLHVEHLRRRPDEAISEPNAVRQLLVQSVSMPDAWRMQESKI